MSFSIWVVDAFADRPFAGNPAAVCIMDRYPNEAWMQNVASEMNLSETAFIVPGDGANQFQLRWFTPKIEVDLCGHATLASAHLLIEQGRADESAPIRFQSRSGELICNRNAGAITMDFPATPPGEKAEAGTIHELELALGVDNLEVLRSKFDLLAVVDDENMICSLSPDFGRLALVPARGVIATAKSSREGIDFVSRFFAPQSGVNEDPVTGSAHCCLAPYWSRRLGQSATVGYQASARGGRVECEYIDDRVQLTGKARTVLEGRLLVKPE